MPVIAQSQDRNSGTILARPERLRHRITGSLRYPARQLFKLDNHTIYPVGKTGQMILLQHERRGLLPLLPRWHLNILVLELKDPIADFRDAPLGTGLWNLTTTKGRDSLKLSAGKMRETDAQTLHWMQWQTPIAFQLVQAKQIHKPQGTKFVQAEMALEHGIGQPVRRVHSLRVPSLNSHCHRRPLLKFLVDTLNTLNSLKSAFSNAFFIIVPINTVVHLQCKTKSRKGKRFHFLEQWKITTVDKTAVVKPLTSTEKVEPIETIFHFATTNHSPPPPPHTYPP